VRPLDDELDDIPFPELAEGVLGYFTWPDEVASGLPAGMRQLREAVAFRVADLLDRNLERLTQLFYRIDVPEKAVDAVFAEYAADDLADGIADLLIAREVARIRTRREFEST